MPAIIRAGVIKDSHQCRCFYPKSCVQQGHRSSADKGKYQGWCSANCHPFVFLSQLQSKANSIFFGLYSPIWSSQTVSLRLIFEKAHIGRSIQWREKAEKSMGFIFSKDHILWVSESPDNCLKWQLIYFIFSRFQVGSLLLLLVRSPSGCFTSHCFLNRLIHSNTTELELDKSKLGSVNLHPETSLDVLDGKIWGVSGWKMNTSVCSFLSCASLFSHCSTKVCTSEQSHCDVLSESTYRYIRAAWIWSFGVWGQEVWEPRTISFAMPVGNQSPLLMTKCFVRSSGKTFVPSKMHIRENGQFCLLLVITGIICVGTFTLLIFTREIPKNLPNTADCNVHCLQNRFHESYKERFRQNVIINRSSASAFLWCFFCSVEIDKTPDALFSSCSGVDPEWDRGAA